MTSGKRNNLRQPARREDIAHSFASERKGGTYADRNKDEEDRQEPRGDEESVDETNVDEKNGDEENGEHDDDARCCAPEFAGQAQVVGRSEHGVDVSAGWALQEGCCDDCTKPGLEKGFAEGAVLRHADADVLRQSRGKESDEEPAEGAGPGEGTSARAHGEEPH